MTRRAVLVITNELDVGADFLVRELDRREVPVVRFNAERAPNWKLTLRPFVGWSVTGFQRSLNSEECAGVWWRRPEAPAFPSAGNAEEAMADQWRAFLSQMTTAPGPVWVSQPERIRVAENKAAQIGRAQEAGLAVPETVWTNDVDEGKQLCESWGGAAVVKSVTTAWWEEGERGRFVFASLIKQEDLPSAGRLASSPVCFQQPVLPKRDIRVTVVGNEVFSAARGQDADTPPEPLDWRLAPQTDWLVHDLPSEVLAGCRAVVKSFGLRFGAIDLAQDAQGDYWFLELNPNGEWGWLQRAGLPISSALADCLLGRDR